MSFEKVATSGVDFPARESAILNFWAEKQIFEKLKAQNAGKPKWSFLDGPITANNPMGVHHAWNRTYKDAYCRYFAMTGHALRYQQGFDCQGLWVEVEVEKELKLHSKKDIEALVPGDPEASVAKFVNLCKARVDKYADIQTKQSIRLGYWMNWDTEEDFKKSPDNRKSYFTNSEENNYTIWSFLKKCHHRGLLYRGFDAMPWCGRCGTGISEMEKSEGYKIIAHRAIFVKFPLRDKPGENLIAWTTTPWTLTSNVAAAVNPELVYLKIKLGSEIYYIAKGAFKAARLEEQFKAKEWVEGVPKLKSLEQIFKEKAGKEGFEILGELKGEEMIGWAYNGPFDQVEAQNAPYGYPAELAEVVSKQGWSKDYSAKQAHRVIAWKDVGESEGTGIVHIAPGCGAEDFHLGKENLIPFVAPLDETGHFLPGFGELSGKHANPPETVDWIINYLKQKGILFAVEQYPHKYPHCWRCKQELLYRLVDEWYISMTWRDEIMRVVEQVTFLPESVNGRARELDWLRNMGDWMISKKRYWGLALPIWVDPQTGDFEVIGSREELKQRAVEGWSEFEGNTPHRPWVDQIKIRNPKTGNLMSRVPDVGNPWLDAGIVAFSTMKWNTDREYWKQWYPAEFITESFPGQFRNWFYALLAMSTMMSDGQPPFKTLLGFATVLDQDGRAMHKSEGNSIEFIGAAESGFTIDHPLKEKEQPKLPEGALSFEVVEKKDKEGKPIRAVRASYPPIGADVMRWLYCRHNPAQNLNFGPVPANELRAKFVLKLWNTYAFFVNYARLDDFDRTAEPIPFSQRSDLDRWILSDLQGLVKLARESFESFDTQRFCLEVESFIDDKLSNWYVRRSRRRFWKSEQGNDKSSAYQTLYVVLKSLAQLIAPIVPFLAEDLWQNLRSPKDAESVHLVAYPKVQEDWLDSTLSEEVNALLKLVSVGGAARNVAKIKTRQPLAELIVQPAEDAERRAAERFGDQLCEELNVKKVKIIPTDAPALMKDSVKLNMKTAGAKCGAKLKEVNAYIATLKASQLYEALKKGSFEIAEVPLESGDFIVNYEAPAGFAGVVEKGTQVLLDTKISPELRLEGLARDIIRNVQDLRKKANLEMEDRIVLSIESEAEEIRQSLQAHRNSIGEETLTTEWKEQLDNALDTTSVKIDGMPLTIRLKKA
ncbi:isoleucine--tRNA ligase [Telmatocola sphagniphila]|uniref:Isoleucine--tRNA ligase n=1 Tax=Telmatocola sphagniphila TaxID=1123043 RepID=A0A8E6B8S8_9BACT|nr:isoleucine--tRNA ligase [Telmatocola sphagniphila]QVL34245.1 isoleucine--tRNA ligase [Telmatocola sphagniphila]